jgi:hypothetical protein
MLYYDLYLYSPNPALFANIGTVRAGGGKTPKAISAHSGGDLEDVDDIAAEITAQM